jgi:thioredoxin-related protein
MRKLFAIIAAALFAAAPFTGVQARQDLGNPSGPATSYELIVFEVDGCIYCQDFRARVQPLYTASALGREAPLRYVNVSRSDETKMGLSGAITIAPTVVLMLNGQEVDRIVGYTGPSDFLKLVAHMMGRGD